MDHNNSVNSIVPSTVPTLHNGESAKKPGNIFDNDEDNE